ncbi:MAG: hypothetical protein Q8R40_00300 [bacterium]|nr:hypothetical protein [bacterium]
MPKVVAVAVLISIFWVPIVAMLDKILRTAYVSRLTVAITGQQYTGFMDAFLDINSSLLVIALLSVTMVILGVAVVGVVLVALMSLLGS